MKVYLCRHGETEENAAGILQGQLQGHLSHLGLLQAAALGEKLGRLKADCVVCSDLRRAIDTARIALGEECRLAMEPLLRERDWGRYTGMPIRDALALGCNESTPCCGEAMPGDGAPESVDHLLHRAASLIEKWRDRYDGKTVIAVGHGLFNRAVIAAAQGVALREVPRYGNAEVRELIIDRPPVVVTNQEETRATAN